MWMRVIIYNIETFLKRYEKTVGTWYNKYISAAINYIFMQLSVV